MVAPRFLGLELVLLLVMLDGGPALEDRKDRSPPDKQSSGLSVVWNRSPWRDFGPDGWGLGSGTALQG